MQQVDFPSNYSCRFCGNSLSSRYSKCFNIYCEGQEFALGNLVLYRLNIDLGIGRVVKILEIPVSKAIEKDDTSTIVKYKVKFRNNIVKIIHPIDLIHFIFDVNEKIVSKSGIGIVNSNSVSISKGMLSYEILHSNGKLEQVYETEIKDKFVQSVRKTIFRKRVQSPQQFLLKYWANMFDSYYTSYQIKCITNSRLSLMPHQINVAHRLSEDYFPRVILADEVGLGKTIEAGIYIKEMMARQLAERVLIIVPASLVRQWEFEMDNKFNLKFEVYDGHKVKSLKKHGHYKHAQPYFNPFYYDNLIICSLQFARSPKYIELLSQIPWDVVIFDEAHHLRRYLTNSSSGNYRETLNYELGRKLSYSSESMLLLSATPLQLHSFELYSLIELIQPEAFENFSDFEHFRKNMPFINLLVSNVDQIEKLNTFEVKNTVKLLKNLKYISMEESFQSVVSKARDPIFRLNLIKKLEKDHTLAKFLIRNRKKNVFSEEFLNKRIVNTIMVKPTRNELNVYNEIRLYLAKIYNSSVNQGNIGIGFIVSTLQKLLTSSKPAIKKSIERRLEHIKNIKELSSNIDILKEIDPEYFELIVEDEYLDLEISSSTKTSLKNEKQEELLDLLNQEHILKKFSEKLDMLQKDSKPEKLIDLISEIYKNDPENKVLIFTQFVDTMFYLKEILQKCNPEFFIDIFYGGLDKEEKDIAVEKFRTSDTFSILISTEIGGEGRNFQFCHVLVNYDLPWNPMKLEQRIGRLDRIGQKSKDIFIYNFFLDGTVETDIVYALLKRINLFEESIGVLEPIIGRIERDFKNLVFTVDDGKKRKRLNELNRSLDEEIKKAKEIEMQLDDLLIDKKSFQMDGLITNLGCEEVKLSHNELYLFSRYFFNLKSNFYGSMAKILLPNSKTMENHNHISEIALSSNFVSKTRERLQNTYRGTFSLDMAREKEEIDFFALGHKLVENIIDICKRPDFEGEFTVLNVKKDSLKAYSFKNLDGDSNKYLFVFIVKYQGYIIERRIVAVVLDDKGEVCEELSDIILNIENYEKIFDFMDTIEDTFGLNETQFNNFQYQAKSYVKKQTSQWKLNIQLLNDKIFTQEQDKKRKIYEHKRKTLLLRIDNQGRTLERKKKQRPTNRRLRNIENLTDLKRKRERLNEIKSLEEQIRVLEKKIENSRKQLDDLEFEYEDMKNEMKRRNLAKFYTNLLSFAIIKFV